MARSSSATATLEVNLTDRSLYEYGFPHELFTELRQRHCVAWQPRVRVDNGGNVHGSSETEVEFWAVLGHAEIEQVHRDWETFSAVDGPSLIAGAMGGQGLSIVDLDPPAQTRMRKLISAGFTPRMVGRLEEQIRTRTTRILDAATEKGAFDFVSEIAFALPMHVISDIIGIPEDDRLEVFRFTETMLEALDPALGISPEQGAQAAEGLYEYASELSTQKRHKPTDDVWSILAASELGQLELDLFFIILALAGSETTQNALSQSLVALINHPEQCDELRNTPSLLPSATEEFLRWSSPVTCFGRTATRDVELGGQRLQAGDRVGLFYPSANRDQHTFEDPFRFDIHRSPNPHFAFGAGGPHFCLGASLARSEMQVMIGELLKRFHVIEITSEPQWISSGPVNTIGVAIRSLPIRVEPRS